MTIIERDRPARGVAYGTKERRHLLNVPAGRMSALPEEPEHFLRWLKEHDLSANSSTFAPRADFGAYLEELLAAHLDRIDVIIGEAIDIEGTSRGGVVKLADGRRIEGEVIVLALGNPPPSAPCPLDETVANDARYVANPWAPGSLDRIARSGDAPTVLLGTGLTMIDVMLSLLSRDPSLRCIALSRRGLLPTEHRHASGPPSYARLLEHERWPRTALGMLRSLRTAIAHSDEDWRETINALRPLTPQLWGELPLRERLRFAQRLRTYWDVHRHRMAPESADYVREAIASGALSLRRGKIVAIHATPASLVVSLGSATGDVTIDAANVINCTGPAIDLVRAIPLLAQLAKRGIVRSDSIGWGIDTDAHWSVLDRDGHSQPWLVTFGPLLRGALWETTAVPELRAHAAILAQRLG